MKLGAILAAACVTAACGSAVDGGQGSNIAEYSPTSSTEAASLTTTTSSRMGDVSLEELAVTDLTTRLGVPETEIMVLRSETVTWPDGSLGCPQEGKSYTQSLVEGNRFVLGHGERVYLYHSDGAGPPFLCPSGERDGGYDFIPPPGFDEK